MSGAAVAQVLQEISLRTRSLFTVSARQRPEFHGSGFFTKVHGRLCLVTARHVLEDWNETAPLFFDCGPDRRICQLEGSEYYVRDSSGNEVDAAVVELSGRASAEIDEALIVPTSLLQDDDSTLSEPGYVVAGYLVARNRGAVALDAPTIEPSMYGLVTSASIGEELSVLNRSSSEYLALHWNRKAAYSLEGEKLAGPKLHGLSGAPIWYVGGELPSVAGILIEHHGGELKIIVGVRSRLILRAVGL